MRGKQKNRTVLFIFAATSLATGCSFHGDTSGFKPEQKPSAAQINQQIVQVKANPKIPASIKAMALKKLQDDLSKAR